MARIDTLANFLTDIAAAIKAKTGKTDTITPANFDTEIASIETGGSSEKYAPRHIGFYRYTGTELDEELANLDGKNLTRIGYMFYSITTLTHVDLSTVDNLDVANITYIGYMFYGCTALNNVKFGPMNMSQLENMAGMFQNCSALSSIDLSSWTTTSSLKYLTYAFSGCSGLTYLDIRCIDFTNVRFQTDMLLNVPTTCEIIVADDTAKSWMNSKFSAYTNVKTVAEKEAEA